MPKTKAPASPMQGESAYLVNMVNNQKYCRPVWENKPEEVKDQPRENLPALILGRL